MANWAIFILAAVTQLFNNVSAEPNRHLTIVHTSNGPILSHNRDDAGIHAFKGIPFAAPPIGDQRWRAPTSPEPWTEPLNTTSFGAACYVFQGDGPIPPPPGPQSEDCLFLNVWTASPNTDERRPVMVWIHGGGFETGSSIMSTYDGSFFAQAGVVLVSFNYRLGNFGFLAHPDLDAEGSNSGNFGLLDQILALDWVRANIESFGGDAQNVVVFGESAGAHAIGLLMASLLAQGRFDKAIIQSGAWWDSDHGNLLDFDEARAKGTKWAEKFGDSPSLSQLRLLSSETIVSNSKWNFDEDPSIAAFAPSLDGFVLPDLPAKVFEAGLQSRVPLLAGWNREEGLLFESRSLAKSSPEEFRTGLYRYFDVPGRNRIQTEERLDALYPAGLGPEVNASIKLPTENHDAQQVLGSANDAASQAIASANLLIGDLVITEQTWEAAHLHSKTGAPTYVYYYNYSSPYCPVPHHSFEIEFVFGNLGESGSPIDPSEDDHKFSSQVRQYWVNFATSGDPNLPSKGPANWPRFAADSRNSLILELSNVIKVIKGDLERLEFIRSFRVDGALPQEWRGIVLECC